ncbi:MAG: hypothetical protein AAFQ98_08490 [Bacteroidota bacterium]
MHKHILSLLVALSATIISTYGQSSWKHPVPEGLTRYEWRGLRVGWDQRARTVDITKTDGTTVNGFFLGAFDQGIALLKDQPHPFVTAEQMEVVVVPPTEIKQLTVSTLNNRWHRPLVSALAVSAIGASVFAPLGYPYGFGLIVSVPYLGLPTLLGMTIPRILYPAKLTFALPPTGSTLYNSLQKKLLPYQQTPQLSYALTLPNYAPTDPGDPSTYMSMAPIFPTVERYFKPLKWNIQLTANTPLYHSLVTSSERLAEGIGYEISPDVSNLTLLNQLTIHYSLRPNLQLGLDVQHLNAQLSVSQSTVDSFATGYIRWGVTTVMGLAQLPIVQADLVKKQRHGLYLGLGVGAAIRPMNYRIEIGRMDDVELRVGQRVNIRPASQAVVSYEYLIMQNIGLQLRLGANGVWPDTLTDILPDPVNEVQLPFSSIYGGLGISIHL